MTTTLTRRSVLKTAAFASTAVAAPFVHGAFAAGKLSCGFWDHWVPTATAPLEQLCREWAAKEKVDITVDFITSNGDKALLTMAAEKCFKGGYPFGMPMSTTPDAVNWVGTMFAAHGVRLVDEEGNITVNSDATRQVLEWFKKAVPFFPPTVFAWNDASNNKALISGQSALIMNSPSAWAVAKRDAPKIAEQLSTFQPPKGPNGRFDTGINRFWGMWNFSANKSAAKSLLTYLSTRSAVEHLVNASQGYDVPPFEKLNY